MQIIGTRIIDTPTEVDESIHVMGELILRPGGWIIFPQDGGFDLMVMEGGTFRVEGNFKVPFVECPTVGAFSEYRNGVEKALAKPGTDPSWEDDDFLITVNPLGEKDDPFTYRYNGREYPSYTVNLTRSCGVKAHGNAHIMCMPGGKMFIDGGEFGGLGIRGRLGRYPIHWHLNGATTGYIRNSSIWSPEGKPGSRFVTIHGTQGILVKDNVFYNCVGHGVYEENGDEWDNVIQGNFSIDVFGPEEIPAQSKERTNDTHHYWIRNQTTFRNNFAAGTNADHRWAYTKVGDSEKRTFTTGGFIVLPSNGDKQQKPVEGFTGYNCGSYGYWADVPDVDYHDITLTHCTRAAYIGYQPWGVNDSGSTHYNPAYLFCGDGIEGKWDGTRTENAAAIFMNWGDYVAVNPTIVGGKAIHLHYARERGVTFYGGQGNVNTLSDMSYWEGDFDLVGGRWDVGYTFDTGYHNYATKNDGKTPKRTPPDDIRGYARINKTLINGIDATGFYTGPWGVSYLEADGWTVVDNEIPGRRFATIVKDGVELPTAPGEPDPADPPPEPEPEPLTLEQRVLRIEKILGIE